MDLLSDTKERLSVFTDGESRFMEIALNEAAKAAKIGEVPIGAVVVGRDNQIISSAGNRSIKYSDPSAHAEIIALRDAGAKLNNYRLLDSTVYVTLEPCLMCMGAMIHARIKRLVFAATDPKTGAVISQYFIGQDGRLNHNIVVDHGLYAAESAKILKQFFGNKRKKNRNYLA